MTGHVTLVGGGPGDPGLVTMAGMAALRAADVVLYDHLAPVAALDECRPGTVLIEVGKIPASRTTSQQRINDLLIERNIDCPIHVDAASGGFVAPFVNPDLIWDFRLEKVSSHCSSFGSIATH